MVNSMTNSTGNSNEIRYPQAWNKRAGDGVGDPNKLSNKISKTVEILDGWFKYDKVVETPHGTIYIEKAIKVSPQSFMEELG